jgi:hypothetical protein
MATGIGRTKLNAAPQQPPLSSKDQNPTSFKRVTMGIHKGSNPSAMGRHKNNGKGVY